MNLWINKIAAALEVDIRELFHPTKEGGQYTDIFIKDEAGNDVKVGSIDFGKG